MLRPRGPGPTYDGYNFVGNPYPSALNWNVNDGSGWTRTAGSVLNTLWIWNQPAGNYGVYIKGQSDGLLGADSIIPPHQGFFIHCTASNGYIGVENGARIHNPKEILKSSAVWTNPTLGLSVNGNDYSDEIRLIIDPEAAINYEDDKDALKMRGLPIAPQLYSLSFEGEALSLNSFPDAENFKVIQLCLEVGNPATYTFSLSGFYGFGSNGNLYLEDKKEDTFLKIENDAFTYSFVANPSDDPGRFLLHLNGEMGINSNETGLTQVKIYASVKDVYITSPNNLNGLVTGYDLLGKAVMREQIEGQSIIKIGAGSHKGYMLVTFRSEEGSISEKVFIR